MRPKEIKKLIELLEKSNINELEVSRWGKRIRLSKTMNSQANLSSVPAAVRVAEQPPVQQVQEIAPPVETVPAVADESVPATAKIDLANIIEVKTPMVGTFYEAPAPGAAPFVKVGDTVSVGQTLCIIEAMKLMNEIESEVRGRISEILVEDKHPVEYNQVIIKIEKL